MTMTAERMINARHAGTRVDFATLVKCFDARHLTHALDVDLLYVAAAIHADDQRPAAIVEPHPAVETNGALAVADVLPPATDLDPFNPALRQSNLGDLLINDRAAPLRRRITLRGGWGSRHQ